MKILKSLIFVLFFVLVFTAVPQNPKALRSPSGLKQFGGFITLMSVCTVPVAEAFVTVHPLGVGSSSSLFIPGASFPFLYGPPSHPGQGILGMELPTPTPCLIPAPHTGLMVNPIIPAGFPVLYEGDTPI